MIHLSYLLQPFNKLEVLANRGNELLNDVERARLYRYTRDEPKLQLRISRWLIHEQLARSFPHLPRCWRLVSDTAGRPSATHPDIDNQIHYSLSHCEGLIVCAISDRFPVGIDAEPKNQPIKDSFIQVAFTSLEQESIRNSVNKPADEMRLRWTIKESLGKMTGQVGFESVVNFCTGTFLKFDNCEPVFSKAYNVWVFHLPISNGHFVTLVVAQDRLFPPEIEIIDSSNWVD